MSFFSADLESMVELYQRETAELMEGFDQILTRAVQENHLSADDINAVFRVVHTIKSSAAMMGLADISTCTHRMEDLFYIFRDRPDRLNGNENRLFDLMYTFSDYIGKENERVSQKDFQPGSAAEVIRAIEQELEFYGAKEKEEQQDTSSAAPEKAAAPEVSASDRTGTPKTEEAAAENAEKPVQSVPAAPAPAQNGESVWRVRLRQNVQMENVRAFMLVRQISGLCTKLRTDPVNLESRDAASRIAQNGLLLYLISEHEEELQKKLSASPYVSGIERLEEAGSQGKPAEEAAVQASQPADREGTKASGQNKYSMVSWQQICRLTDVTGELITAGTILGASIQKESKGGALENEFQSLHRQLQELEKLVAAVSMMPVSSATPQYYRLVREIAGREGKQIRFQVIGEEIEVDRNLLDTLANPLIHLLRNAADHGIELPQDRAAAGKDRIGHVVLQFENLTDHLRVAVRDDGQGIDTQKLLEKASARGLLTKDKKLYTKEEALQLTFLPGLSTNEQTNQYSGRGVGMDVVQNIVGNLGGSVKLESESGKGSVITMEVPVSMTSAECIRFQVGVHTCLIPIRNVVRIYSLKEAEERLQVIDGHRFFQTDEMLPVLDMFRLYGQKQEGNLRLIVIRDADNSAALFTGPVTGQQTAVEKPLPGLLGRRYRAETGIIGCAVTETGRFGMMLNANRLIQLCRKDVVWNGA